MPGDQPYPHTDQTLYGAPATYGAAPAAQPFWKNRRNVVVAAVAGIVLVLVIAGIAIAALGSGGGSQFEVGSCVKQAGDQAKPVSCSTQGSYTIVSKVDSQDKCPDKGQPFAILQRKGSSDQVLCLKPTR